MYNKTLKRRELKYFINNADYLNLVNTISHFFLKDKNISEKGYYHIRSLYFDNKSNDSYYEKIDGIEKKKKFRIRIYDLRSNPIKLEIKSKVNNIVLKETMLISKQDMEDIISGDYSCLLNSNNSIAKKIYYYFIKDYYKPVILIDYKREAYYFDLNKIRITFDKEIKKNEINPISLFKKDINMSPVFNNFKIILEIKYTDSIPTWIKNLLQTPRFEKCAISKYSLSRYMEN
jgi:hypothetical protein